MQDRDEQSGHGKAQAGRCDWQRDSGEAKPPAMCAAHVVLNCLAIRVASTASNKHACCFQACTWMMEGSTLSP